MAANAPQVYVIVNGAVPAIAGIGEEDTINQTLAWIGFNTDAQRQTIMSEAFGSFDDLRATSTGDLEAMAKDLTGRTAALGRIIVGIRRTRLLKGLTHWIKDFYRESATPDIEGMDENSFKAALNVALRRDEIRANLRKQVKTAADAASPGPLESERKWKAWEEKFTNYCRAHIGANGVPLSYVIRENDAPDVDGNYTDYISKTIACAPLSGEYYESDRLAVFNMIVSLTTGEPSGDWIKNTLRHSDGRRSMKALRDHFAGEGNASRNKAEADRLYQDLHYKSERAMPFETFLTNCQKMFNIFEKEGEPMPEAARVRFLFKKVQHKDMQLSIESLQAQQTAGTVITYTMAANHLTTKVSTLPEYISKNRSISAVGKSVSFSSSSGNDASIHNSDGTINTGFIPNWRSLSKEQRDTVMAERKRLGISGGKSTGKSNKTDANRLKQLITQNKKHKRTIKSLRRTSSGSKDDDGASDGGDESGDSDTDAGDQFAGKRSKKKGKKK
jgi:hypothetical protein